MKTVNKIILLSLSFLILFLISFGLNIKDVSGETVKFTSGKEFSLSNYNGNLNNINLKIEITSSIDLDGKNNALLIGLVSGDNTILTDERFLIEPTDSGIIMNDGTSIIYDDELPKTIGSKTINGSYYTYSFETKDFDIRNASKNISKLVVIGQKGDEFDATINVEEVKYSIKFGNNNAILYSYNELINAPDESITFDVYGHTEIKGWETDDSIKFVSMGTYATIDMVFNPIGEKESHNWIAYELIPATSDSSGMKAHERCSCGAIRFNEDSKTLITESELIIPALTHVCSYRAIFDWTNAIKPGDKPYVALKCDGCGLTKTIEEENIVLCEKPNSKVAPSCIEDGSITYVASINCDGIDAKDERSYRINKTGHNLEYVSETISSCTSEGIKEHYHCLTCGKAYEDELAVTELTDIIIPKSHHLLKVSAVDATCERDGNIEYYYCSECGKNFDSLGRFIASVVVRSTGHSYGDSGKCNICGKMKPNYDPNPSKGCFSSVEPVGILFILGMAIPLLKKNKKE